MLHFTQLNTFHRAACMYAWDAPEGGPCFFRPAGIYCPDKNPEAAKTQAPCFDLNEQGNYTIKPGRGSCCKDATIDERGIQLGGCPLSSLTSTTWQCKWGQQGISFVLNMEYGFYYNVSIDEHHRPHGCKVSNENMMLWLLVHY